MRSNHFRCGIIILALLFITVFSSFAASAAPAGKYKVIYSFNGAPDAAYPGGLTFDADGNLYGTSGGGAYNFGAVFELKRTADGWAESVLYSFTGDSGDTGPVTGVILDNAGNLYGLSDGYSDSYAYPAYVFKLAPNGHGEWTKSVLYKFDTSTHTYLQPQNNLVVDSQGNLFGFLPSGSDGGLAFELKPGAKGDWKEVTLHSFKGTPDGAYLTSAALDQSGNVWGMTTAGGTKRCVYIERVFGCGIVYELTPDSSGKWSETVVYEFTRGGGQSVNPSQGFLLESGSQLFGTAFSGGNGFGAVFELTRTRGSWEQQVLYRFLDYPDGQFPIGQLEMNSAGALFGVTFYGGKNNLGIVFELDPSKTQDWGEKILHSFVGGLDGSYPDAAVVFDSRGHLYGATEEGGSGAGCGKTGCGVIYEIDPNSQ
jgi:uncharacterized repeat protein (TIGR03803 family)